MPGVQPYLLSECVLDEGIQSMHPGEVVLMGHLSPVAVESDPGTTCQANKMHLFNHRRLKLGP